jgi:hypothetical protein
MITEEVPRTYIITSLLIWLLLKRYFIFVDQERGYKMCTPRNFISDLTYDDEICRACSMRGRDTGG